MTSVPLAVAYGAVPLGTAAARYAGEGTSVSITAPWLLLAAIGLLLAMYRDKPGTPMKRGFFFKVTLFLLMVAGLFMYTPDLLTLASLYLPYLRESAPLIFLLFCGLWASTAGLPDRADFQRFGALLSVLCIVDLGVEIALYQHVPTVRWLGNADILAGLLLISLCASLKPGGNDGGRYEPDQGNTWWRALIMIGVLSCLSRTGLFAAAWVILCFGRGKFRYRALYSTICALLLVGTFFLPPSASDAIRYTDYWLWVEAIRIFTESPDRLMTGFFIPAPLPVKFPVGMAGIWEAATGVPADFGAYLEQIPSFWLRVIMAWGIFIPLAMLVILFVMLLRRLTRMGAGLTAALFAQGMTTPLIYDPAMGIAIGLALLLALATPLRPNIKLDVTPPPKSKRSEPTDPTEEWNLRPL